MPGRGDFRAPLSQARPSPPASTFLADAVCPHTLPIAYGTPLGKVKGCKDCRHGVFKNISAEYERLRCASAAAPVVEHLGPHMLTPGRNFIVSDDLHVSVSSSITGVELLRRQR